MKKAGIPLLIVGVVLFIAGFVLLAKSGIGILVMIAGIASMIFGSVALMGISGRMKSDYYDNGVTRCTDESVPKYPLEQEKQE